MAQITYVNKEYLYENGDIPAKNKVQDTDMNEIKNVVNSNETKELLAVTDTAPAQCSTGDKYFNTSTKKIYTATATNTWGTTGVNPTRNTIYLEFTTQTAYAYDGDTLVSVGGGTGSEDLIVVGTDEPTEDTKLYIESTDLDFQGLEIANSYNTANNVAYSCAYINWKLAGTVTGTTPIQIPSTAKEIYIVSEESGEQHYSKYLLASEIKIGYYYYDGFYVSSSNYGTCAWHSNATNQIQLLIINRIGTWYTNSATTRLYYR